MKRFYSTRWVFILVFPWVLVCSYHVVRLEIYLSNCRSKLSTKKNEFKNEKLAVFFGFRYFRVKIEANVNFFASIIDKSFVNRY